MSAKIRRALYQYRYIVNIVQTVPEVAWQKSEEKTCLELLNLK